MLQTFIRAFDNKNSPILAGNKPVERVYFNLVRLCVVIVAQSGCEIAIAGGVWDRQMAPFRVRPEDVDMIDVGSNETKSRRRIFHILGQNAAGRAGNLLVSEPQCSWDRTSQPGSLDSTSA